MKWDVSFSLLGLLRCTGGIDGFLDRSYFRLQTPIPQIGELSQRLVNGILYHILVILISILISTYSVTDNLAQIFPNASYDFIRSIRGIAIARFVMLRSKCITAEASPSNTAGVVLRDTSNQLHRHRQAASSSLRVQKSSDLLAGKSDDGTLNQGEKDAEVMDLYVLPEWQSLGSQKDETGLDPDRGASGRIIGMFLKPCLPGLLEGGDAVVGPLDTRLDFIAPRSTAGY